MGWIVYLLFIVVSCACTERFISRFRANCTGMTGMMVGMTTAMMNGLVIGYGAAAVTNSMFWGNLIGILIGLALGVYYGRSAGLMGVLDGGMGGVMGGSMGAMLAVMVRYSDQALLGTAALLLVIYITASGALLLLAREATFGSASLPGWLARLLLDTATDHITEHADDLLTDYYALLNLDQDAPSAEIYRAYFMALDHARGDKRPQLENALSTLTDPTKRAVYDQLLARQNIAQQCDISMDERKPRSWRTLLGPVVALFLIADVILLINKGYLANGSGEPEAAQLAQHAISIPVAADGRQTLDLKIDGDTMTYNLQAVKVKRGLPVRFNLSFSGKDPDCGRVVMIPGLAARGLAASGVALAGKIMPMDFTPSQTGVFRINCPMLMMKSAYLVVTD